VNSFEAALFTCVYLHLFLCISTIISNERHLLLCLSPGRLSTRIVIFLILIFSAGCQSNVPASQVTTGAVLLRDDFSRPRTWDSYALEGVDFQVAQGVYRARVTGGVYVWGLNRQAHDDVVIEAESRQLSTDDNNGYGVMCRADPANDGDGYYFLISSDGTYSIRRGRGQEVEALIPWERSSAINTGSARNTIRVVCVGDYLALYVNGQLVAETVDMMYHRGYTGFAVVALTGNEIDVAFDNLTVWEATFAPGA
jgi:hypothetical protein